MTEALFLSLLTLFFFFGLAVAGVYALFCGYILLAIALTVAGCVGMFNALVLIF